jgi:hypothetical protein
MSYNDPSRGSAQIAPAPHSPSGSSRKLPGGGKRKLPRIDDHIAPPETRIEYLDGVKIIAAPAQPPHAMQHFDLTYVLGAHVAEGYRGAVDMLARTDEGSDFAPDASIFPAAPDKKTGGRKLEEIAFEVTDRQAISVPTRKARKLIQRGIRRVFCILVKQMQVLEWSREADDWQPLSKEAVIEDRCLARPLPASALLDAASADDAVARALLAKGVAVLEKAVAEGEARGEARGEALGELHAKRDAIITVLRARGLPVSRGEAQRIAECDDPETLGQWLRQAVKVASVAMLLQPSGGAKSGRTMKAKK